MFVLLQPGDLALESITEACEKHDVDSGVVVSGIGTFRNLNFHYVPTTDFPAEKAKRNTFLNLDGAWEIGTIDGAIADGKPHLHLVAYNGEETVAGHIEDGCEVHILSELVIRKIDGLELTRKPNEKNVSTLQRR
ncbi:DNA-binding protein [Halogeometricum sp. S1BR25-6]|uniref:DNA-binding protein n=1 Tax=Halogeometricum salsisoli TaxID=2950536 RepID=A0ABU2GH82_9EURY|nr:DNA-binding protein [Halogeometricum sp. S1BR25-6]MDS0300175.1 DNA-binding protein [Halogeometricum sp. S1BR25-6]